MDFCFVCGNETRSYDLTFTGPGVRIPCRTCGEFRLSERVVADLQQRMIPPSFLREASIEGLPQVSGAIRELTSGGADVFVADFDELLASVSLPQDPLDSIDKIVLYVYRKTSSAAEFVELKPSIDYSVAYARDKDEFMYLLERAVDIGLVELNEFDQDDVRLKVPGWQRVRELRKANPDSRQAFVAMWFADDLGPAFFDGIQPALEECGYRPLRIDMSEHNDKIDDRIVAEIRKSAILVADFTGHRGGVYFEAGFAMGLGLPVIWTCRESDMDAAHFDTRQYNHIVWSNVADLRAKLKARVEATLPVWTPIARST